MVSAFPAPVVGVRLNTHSATCRPQQYVTVKGGLSSSECITVPGHTFSTAVNDCCGDFCPWMKVHTDIHYTLLFYNTIQLRQTSTSIKNLDTLYVCQASRKSFIESADTPHVGHPSLSHATIFQLLSLAPQRPAE